MRAGAVKRLAGAAIDAWGRIDVWINNAGVTAFARIDEGSLADHRRVIETNLFGAIHGARAVVPIFREQQRGTLVDVGSVLSKVGNPLARATRNAVELERYNPNYVGGDINGGLADLRQLLLRPVARLDPYATPAPDVFLCSSSTPPGGGVHGMCGYWCARRVLARALA